MNFFEKLFNHSKPENPEDDFEVTVTETFVKVSHINRKTQQIFLKDILEIKLINTNTGPTTPDIWLALTGKGEGCFIPISAEGYNEVFDIVSKYNNFNFENYIKSMSCAEAAEFHLWTKK